MLKINGVEMPAPLPYTVEMMDLSKAERLASGDMVIEIIATKTKLPLEWGKLTSAELSQILNAIKPALFEVEYFDPEDGGLYTKTFYKGDRRMPIATVENGEPIWDGASFNIIER